MSTTHRHEHQTHPDEVQSSSWIPSFLVEGAIRKAWEVDEEFLRPSHDVVLSESFRVRPIWRTGLIGYLMTMWCSRPTRVGGLHHQRSQPQITRFTSRKDGGSFKSLSYDGFNLSSKSSLVCSILHILCNKRESRLEACTKSAKIPMALSSFVTTAHMWSALTHSMRASAVPARKLREQCRITHASSTA